MRAVIVASPLTSVASLAVVIVQFFNARHFSYVEQDLSLIRQFLVRVKIYASLEHL